MCHGKTSCIDEQSSSIEISSDSDMNAVSRAMGHGLLLSEAPDRFFDPRAWADLKSNAGQRYSALAMLNAPIPEPQGDGFWGPVDSDEQFRIRSRHAQRARELAYQFRCGLCGGTYVAAGIPTDSASRVVVDRDLCGELWPMFATDRLCGLHHEFTQVRVVEAAKCANATQLFLERVEDWLKARMVEGESSRKILFHKAKTHFGEMLTNRLFDVAYKAVFNRSRGRPSTAR